MKELKYIVAVLIAIAFGFWIGTNASRRGKSKNDTTIVTRTEVKHHVDTVTELLPYRVPSLIYKTVHDSIFVSKDTILAREHKEYSDTMYTAWVSGIDASLDSIDVYKKTIYMCDTISRWNEIYIREKPKRWHFGFNAGYGYNFSGKKIAPYIGLGINYTFFSW